jgi:subtilisin-like proprotein convertase family protein
MNRRFLWTFSAALLLLGGLAFTSDNLLDSQQSDPIGPRSSLELGEPHDRNAQLRLRDMTDAPLIKLVSRYVIPDAECPVPESEMPFFVRLHEVLSRAQHDDWRNAGLEFVGYAKPHTYILRAGPRVDRADLRVLLRDHPNVAGTALMHESDRFDPQAWELRQNWLAGGGLVEVLFWGDVPAFAAEAFLERIGAEIIEASRDQDGRMNLHTRFVVLAVDANAFREIDASPLVEYIHPHLPFQTDNLESTQLSNASEADVGPTSPYNLTGNGVIMGVWDSAPARSTHVTFGGRAIPMDSNHSDHGTHVTGTVIGDGTGTNTGRGYAPQATALGFNWNNMSAQRREARHTHKIISSTHSYGIGATSTNITNYHSRARQHDIDLRDMLMAMTQSAGNTGRPGQVTVDGSGTINGDRGMKNAFVIGATDGSGTIADFSSRGPGRDGRLMPQFTAKGVSVYSSGNASDTTYRNASGTSMSTPSVAGSIVLLNELWKHERGNKFLAPDTLRAMLALTAIDRWYEGPDYRYGFGIVDAKTSADLILANRQSGGRNLVRGTIRQGDILEYTFDVTNSADPLKVSLAWLDIHASTTASIILINDLDIELISPTNVTHYPYVGRDTDGTQDYQFTQDGPNRRDNTLLVNVDNPAVGTWTVRVIGHQIPPWPQTGVPNVSTGFVLASYIPLERDHVFVADSLNVSNPVAIPDNNTAGVTRTLSVSTQGVVGQVRVLTHIKHQRRGDLDIRLRGPDGTSVTIEAMNSSTLRDIIGVFPDTRQYAGDTDVFHRRQADGDWIITVSDRTAGEIGTIDYLAIEIDLEPNEPPVLVVSPDVSVRETDPVTLSADGSYDPENEGLTFEWTQISGPPAAFGAANRPTIHFNAPNVTTNSRLTFNIRVTDFGGAYTEATVNVDVAPNLPPVVVVGPDIQAIEGDVITLDATGTYDPEGDAITFTWTQTQGSPMVSLSDTASEVTSFTVPAIGPGEDDELHFRVTVEDDRGASAHATVKVLVQHNLPPVAVISGSRISVPYGVTVQLDGSGSSDPNLGDTLTYEWIQVRGEAQIKVGAWDAAATSFVTPMHDDIIEFLLVVTDRQGLQDIALVQIYVAEDGEIPPPLPYIPPSDDSSGGCAGGGGPVAPWLFGAVLFAAGFIRRRKLVPALTRS